jgi:uncharacterized Zn-binding protein involved in type VI secretion
MLPIPVPRDGPGDRPTHTGPELAVPLTEDTEPRLRKAGDGVQCPERRGRQAGSPVSRPCVA